MLYAEANNIPFMQEASFVGEDAAYFAVEEQSTGKWAFFTAELAIVLAIMYVVRHPA